MTKTSAFPVYRYMYSHVGPLSTIDSFALYGWQMLWRNAQNDEAPFFAFALVEWFNMARDGLAQGWEWATWLYQRVVELGE